MVLKIIETVGDRKDLGHVKLRVLDETGEAMEVERRGREQREDSEDFMGSRRNQKDGRTKIYWIVNCENEKSKQLEVVFTDHGRAASRVQIQDSNLSKATGLIRSLQLGYNLQQWVVTERKCTSTSFH